MSPAGLEPALASLLVLATVIGLKSGRCEHTCEICKVRREKETAERVALQKKREHDWHVRVGYRIDGCEPCDRTRPKKDDVSGNAP